MKKVSNKLRVLHYPQIPCKPFVVEVKDEEQAYLLQETLANQHLFLFENNFIPDYSNIITVVMWDENADGKGNADWVDYYNDEEGMDWGELVEAYMSYDNIDFNEKQEREIFQAYLDGYDVGNIDGGQSVNNNVENAVQYVKNNFNEDFEL